MADVAINTKELSQAISKLKAIGDQFPKRKLQNLLKRGAIPMEEAAKANIPISPRVGKRYGTPKIGLRKRAPKGRGRVLIETPPGTARNSIKRKALRNTSDIIVGPTTGKSAKHDAWFFAFLEFRVVNVDGSVRPPQAPMRRALSSTGQRVADNIARESAEVIEKYVKANGI